MNEKFDKFTERARHVLALAQEEAQRFNHNYIGTEHLLLGLVREQDGVAAKVLSNLGVELNKVRSAVEFTIGRGEHTVQGEIGLTPEAKRVIDLSVDEARRLNHHYIGTEHLLLGLVREGEGVAAGVLESVGVNLEKVRREVAIVLSQPADSTVGPRGSFQSARRTATVGMSVTNTTTLILYCRDVEATRAFYVDQLGAMALPSANLVVAGFAEGDVLLLMQRVGPLLALRAADAASEPIAPTAAGAVAINILVPEIDALWSRWNELRKGNAPGLSEMEAFGPDSKAPQLRAFSVTDPDGRTLRLYSLAPGS